MVTPEDITISFVPKTLRHLCRRLSKEAFSSCSQAFSTSENGGQDHSRAGAGGRPLEPSSGPTLLQPSWLDLLPHCVKWIVELQEKECSQCL